MLKEIANRRSIRKYAPKPVSDSDILDVIKAGQFAPSANNNQAVEFIIIKNQETKNKLYNVLGQEFVKEAPILIALLTDPRRTSCPIQDIAVASENMFLEATSFGLGTVWKAVSSELASEVKKILDIPLELMVINLIPLGYPEEKSQPHQESDYKPSRIHYEQYGNQ